MSSTIKVLVVDDHPVVRKGLVHMIAEDSQLLVVGEASNGGEALAFILSSEVDVIVSDIDMPQMDGLQLAKSVRNNKPEMGIVLLTMHEDEDLFRAALEHGIQAYLLKDEVIDSICLGIHAASRGEAYVSPTLSKYLLSPRKKDSPALSKFSTLSPAEISVLKLVAENLVSKQIADQLNLSYHTITTHRKNIAQKMELAGKIPLLNFALEHREHIRALHGNTQR